MGWYNATHATTGCSAVAGGCGTHGAVHVSRCVECATHQPPRLQGARTTALPHYDWWFTSCYNQLLQPSLVEYWSWVPPTVVTHTWSNVLNDQKKSPNINQHTSGYPCVPAWQSFFPCQQSI